MKLEILDRGFSGYLKIHILLGIGRVKTRPEGVLANPTRAIIWRTRRKINGPITRPQQNLNPKYILVIMVGSILKSNHNFLHFFTPKFLPYPTHQKSLVHGSSTSVKYICEIVNYDHEIGIGLFFQNIVCMYVCISVNTFRAVSIR